MSAAAAAKTRAGAAAGPHAPDLDVVAGLPGGPEVPVGAAPLSSKESWQEVINLPGSIRPERPSLDSYRSADSAWRQDFDVRRLDHISNFGPIRDVYETVHDQAIRVWRVNSLRRRGLNYGVAIDGSPANGKTTALEEIGRTIERDYRARYPGITVTGDGGEFVPVVYVSLHEKPTTKNFNKLLLHFYGHPAHGHANTAELTNTVTMIVRRCATAVVLIDDIHFLDFKRSDGTDTNNHLKKLANECRHTTFMYAGVDLVERAWLVEGEGPHSTSAQTASRFKRLPVAPFMLDKDVVATRERWQGLLGTFEDELVLLDAQDGDVYYELAEYIHVRTGGRIGAVSQLLREGAVLAIENGQERITDTLLDEIVLDDNSEVASEGKAGKAGGGRRARDPRRKDLDAQRKRVLG